MSDVHMVSAWIPVTNKALEDAPSLHEGISIGLAKSGPPKGTRYHRVWNQGYYQALEDIRSGALEFEDEHFRTGPHWLDRFHEWSEDD